MASIQETIPRPPVRFLSLYAHLPADGRWEGRGTPPARLKPLPSAWPMPAGFPGRGRASASRSGTRPRPFDPSVSPRQFGQSAGPQAGWEPLEDLAGRGGRTRGPRLEAVPPLRRAMKDQRLVRPDGVLAKDSLSGKVVFIPSVEQGIYPQL